MTASLSRLSAPQGASPAAVTCAHLPQSECRAQRFSPIQLAGIADQMPGPRSSIGISWLVGVPGGDTP
jgi:hypothetical protein